jgi:thioester reductase-like protein
MFSTTVQPENYMSQTQTNRNSSIANANAIGTNITPDINFINSHGDSFNNTDLNDDAFGDVEDDFIENNGNEIDRDKVNVNGVIAEDGAENEPAEQIIQPPPRSNEPSPEQNTLKSENTKENLEKTKLKEKNTEPPAEKIEVKEEKKKRGRKKKEPEIKNTTDVQLPLGTDMGPSKNIFDDF